ncbi:MAG: histidine phosphatase family protein [Patescibacteria group bacterium]|nr:histidine phosphatase family protein [Patescibacteria group bacterium]
MFRVLLVRHGQDTDNAAGVLNGRRDTELTELGREQAHQVAAKLKGEGIEIIYSSPLKRAYETAQIIARELGVDEVIADEHLVERDFGVLTGKSGADIPKYAAKRLQTDRVNYFLEAEGAEDFPTCLERGRTIIKEIRERHPNRTILIVTHGDIGKMIRAAYHGWDWERGLKTPYFDNTGVLELSEKQDIIE